MLSRRLDDSCRRPDVSGMRLVCSTDIAISDGTFGGLVLALSYYLYYHFSNLVLYLPAYSYTGI